MGLEKNMLFSLDGKDFATSYGNLKNAQNFVEGTAKSMAYWSNSQGGGRFTNRVSKFFVSKLKFWIMNPEKLPGTNWGSVGYSTRYGKWKQDKFGSVRHWHLVGHVKENIDVIYRGRHSQTVGIRRDIMVPRINLSGKVYGFVRVAWYASLLEFGSKQMEPKPLFMPGMRYFVSTYFPKMTSVVEKAIYTAVNKYAGQLEMKKHVKGDSSDFISAASLNSLNKIASSNPEKDFVFEEGTMDVGGQTTKTEYFPKHLESSKKMHKESAKVLDNWLKSQGLTEKDLED